MLRRISTVGVDTHETIVLVDGITVVGRAPSGPAGAATHAAPDAPRLSRNHAAFVVQPGAHRFVRDISSGSGPCHGVFLNGRMLPRGADIEVFNLDIVTLGPPGSGVEYQLHDEPEDYKPVEDYKMPADEAANLVADPATKAVLDAVREHLQCGVCLETASHAVSPPCGHVCCAICIFSWLERSTGGPRSSCPTCAGPTTVLMHRHDVDSLAEKTLTKTMNGEELAERERRRCAGRAAMASGERMYAAPGDAVAQRVEALGRTIERSLENVELGMHTVVGLATRVEVLHARVADALARMERHASPASHRGDERTRERRAPQRFGF